VVFLLMMVQDDIVVVQVTFVGHAVADFLFARERVMRD